MRTRARHWLVLVTVPNKKTALRITAAILKEKLAACVTAFSVTSQYRWKGNIEHAKEQQLLIKTSAPFEKLRKRILELHPYNVPEVLSFEVEKGFSNYLAWMQKESG